MFFKMLKLFSSLSEKKNKKRLEGKKKKEGGKKKESLIKTATEIPTKLKNCKLKELNKIENLYHSFSTGVNYIQSQF